ncbi:MAG: fumarylacetoacetate hydrolase family protein [Sulfurospirillum sp.]|nr:fumarylacetoacetate hydrolase family protein [Sulfurospirillum sp.]
MSQINFNGKFVTPAKIVCVGRNYVAHIHELGNEIPKEMVVFMKPVSCISSELYAKHLDQEIHYESEISFLVISGKIHGVGFGFDLTKRDLQSTLKKDGLPWERAKCFDGAALFSKFIQFNGLIESLSVKLFVNNALRQDGGVSLMMVKPDDIIAQISSFCKLEDFDIIMSGTPSGVGKLQQGDIYRGEIYSGDTLLVKEEWVAH